MGQRLHAIRRSVDSLDGIGRADHGKGRAIFSIGFDVHNGNRE
jgi:hypothetical protein